MMNSNGIWHYENWMYCTLDSMIIFFLPDFEDALKKREHEFRLQKDEMSAKVLEYELKVNKNIFFFKLHKLNHEQMYIVHQ